MDPPPPSYQEVIEMKKVEEKNLEIENFKKSYDESYQWFVNTFKISNDFAEFARNSQKGFKKVFIVDNSVSMNEKVKYHILSNTTCSTYGKELEYFVSCSIPFLILDSIDGIDFWFTNGVDLQRSSLSAKNIFNWSEVANCFNYNYNNGSVTTMLNNLFNYYYNMIIQRGVIFIILTTKINDNIKLLNSYLKNRILPQNSICNFINFSDETKYFKNLGLECTHVNFYRNFTTEYLEFKENNIDLKYGKYILNSTIGIKEFNFINRKNKKKKKKFLLCW